MKKLFCICLSLLLVLTAFAACGEEKITPCEKHFWVNGKCHVCGELCENHTYVEGKCSNCGMQCKHSSHDRQTLICPDCNYVAYHDFTDGKCRLCDETTIYEYKAVPEKYTVDCPNPGTVVREEYTVEAYAMEIYGDKEEGTLFSNKHVNIYLPYGYDETKDYNILYLMHGSGDNPDYWLAQGEYAGSETAPTKKTIDNLIYYGEIEPLIIVTATYYFDDLTSPEKAVNSDGLTTEFYRELKGTIIPLVEAKYSTFANGNTSKENLIATRDHRAMAGLSMGSMTTYASGLCKSLDYISWFGCYEGCSLTADDILASINTDEFKDYKINFIFNGQGSSDFTNEAHTAAYEGLLEKSDRFIEGENTIMVDKLGFAHGYKNWCIDLYNNLKFHMFK